MNFDCARKLNVRRTGKTRDFYSRSFLFRELLPATIRAEDSELSRFQFECLNEFISDFNLYSLFVSIDSYDPNGNFLNFEFYSFYQLCQNYNQAISTLKQYGKYSHVDIVKDRNLANVGCAVFNSDIMPLNNWLDTEFFYYVKRHAGLHHLAQLMYAVPYKQTHRLRFSYHSSIDKVFGSQVSADEIEYFSLPFCLVWMYRFQQIDLQTLVGWLELLVGMTPKRLALLREMVNIGRYQNKAIAKRLNISDRVVSNYIAEAYNSITHLLPAPEIAGGNLSHCADLVRYYHFLSLAGASTNEFDYL